MQLALINELLGIPPAASEHAPLVDNMLEFAHWFMLVLFVGWFTYFVYALWRFRKSKNPKASYHGVKTKVSTHVEVGVVMIEAVLLLGFALPIWSARVNEFPGEGAVHVRAYGQQFLWNFWYPGPDGVFGKRSNEFVSGSNPVGLDKNDQAAKDDRVLAGAMRLPVNRAVIIELTSKDVIHNASFANFRIAHDAIPGSLVPIWFTPNKLGDFEIICGQLCGNGHYSMKATVTIEPAADFNAWVKGSAPAAPAAAPKTAAATAGLDGGHSL
ncbi:MAG TPA: cytochrome c oxidase subunit II [Chthoniobacterales bacterium]